ncbi:MAG: hypothetical protein AAFY88_06730 [Acidobacteriota bacterium]
MSQNVFQYGARSIELSVDQHISVYVKYANGKLEMYSDAGCLGDAITPLGMDVYRNQSTGLYFYIAASSQGDVTFPSRKSGHLPIRWEGAGDCPDSVQYGKVKSDDKAFSISDQYSHNDRVEHGFDIVVDPGGGSPLVTTAVFQLIDPTIIEKGEDPPPDGSR